MLSVVAGCQSRRSAAPDESPSASAAGAAASAALHPISPTALEAALNPSHEKPYSGPIGSVRGVVRASGDPPPELPDVLAEIPAGKCDDARAFYGKLFREGPGRELGDVLVAVTEYKGFVPEKSDVKLVVARGCAFPSRTIAMTFGQRLDVQNRSRETFIPHLVGTPQAALVVAFPGGDAVKLFPSHPGLFTLRDESHPFVEADVFVLKYPTAAVTGLDGTFEIKNIPVGDVMVSAYLPATGGRTTTHAKIVAGEAATLDLTIAFDAKKFAELKRAAHAAAKAAPAPSASAK